MGGRQRACQARKIAHAFRELSPTPSDYVLLSPTVGSTVGGNGSGMARPEVKEGRGRPRETAGPRESGHTKKLPSYFGEQMEPQPRESSLSFSCLRIPASSVCEKPSSDPTFIPQTRLHSVTHRPQSLSSPLALPSFCSRAPPTTVVQVPAATHPVVATSFSRVL